MSSFFKRLFTQATLGVVVQGVVVQANLAPVNKFNVVPVEISLQAGSAPKISPSLVSLSIEQDRWTDWAGTSATNEFFYNCLMNIYGFTNQHVHIRIGADSEDHTNFQASIPYSETIFPAGTTTVPYPEASNITVGNGYYQLASHLPPGTHVIWGVPLGLDNLTATYLEAQSIVSAFQSPDILDNGIVLDYIEIGNEADLYGNNGARNPATWSVNEYVQQWIQFATNISSIPNIPKFLGAAFAGSSLTTTGFGPQAIFNLGILNSAPGQSIGAISQHHYSGSFCQGSGGLLSNLMDKGSIRSNLSQFTPDIQATLNNGLVYYLGETNSYSCHGAPGVSNTAGAALWALDYALYSSQIGITRLHFHEGVGYKYNLIQPVQLNYSTLDGSPLDPPQAAHVQPPYYAAIVAAEAIGNSGSQNAIEVQCDDGELSGYAFYESGVLKRALFMNHIAYFNTSSVRGFKNVTFTFTGDGPTYTNMVVKRLAIQYADDTSGLTFAGQTYETPDGLVSGELNTTTVPISGGVTVSDTEVVLLSFE